MAGKGLKLPWKNVCRQFLGELEATEAFCCAPRDPDGYETSFPHSAPDPQLNSLPFSSLILELLRLEPWDLLLIYAYFFVEDFKLAIAIAIISSPYAISGPPSDQNHSFPPGCVQRDSRA